MDHNLVSYLGFSHFIGIGPVKLNLLMSIYKDIKLAYGASQSQIADILGPQTALKFTQFRAGFDAQRKLEEFKLKRITVVTRESRYYPEQLKGLSDGPICLYVKGDRELLLEHGQFYFGIVGTRKASPYGLKVAREVVFDMYRRNSLTVFVSGLAYGVDAVVHSASLEIKAPTIAFLGCGVDIAYPYGNRQIYDKIISGGGVVISEFPPGETVVPGLFIARNRLISGISRGVLIVEGSKTSGSLITARYAAEQGRDVFALPGQITAEQAQAPNLLLREGAIAIAGLSDIGDYYGFGVGVPQKSNKQSSLSGEELRLYRYLDGSPRLLDEIVKEFRSPVQEVLTVLSRLELEGVVERRVDEKYSAKAVHQV